MENFSSNRIVCQWNSNQFTPVANFCQALPTVCLLLPINHRSRSENKVCRNCTMIKPLFFCNARSRQNVAKIIICIYTLCTFCIICTSSNQHCCKLLQGLLWLVISSPQQTVPWCAPHPWEQKEHLLLFQGRPLLNLSAVVVERKPIEVFCFREGFPIFKVIPRLDDVRVLSRQWILAKLGSQRESTSSFVEDKY